MKIIISPSKTKKIGVLDGVDSFETPIFSKSFLNIYSHIIL